jgi:hypothetical protein
MTTTRRRRKKGVSRLHGLIGARLRYHSTGRHGHTAPRPEHLERFDLQTGSETNDVRAKTRHSRQLRHTLKDPRPSREAVLAPGPLDDRPDMHVPRKDTCVTFAMQPRHRHIYISIDISIDIYIYRLIDTYMREGSFCDRNRLIQHLVLGRDIEDQI